MFCSKCGDKVEQNEIYCNKCGNYLGGIQNSNNIISNPNSTNFHNTYPNNSLSNTVQNDQYNGNYSQSSSNYKYNNKKMIILGIGGGFGFLLIIFVSIILLNNSKNKFYFSNNNYDDTEQIVQNSNGSSSSTKKSKYSTIIITDNTYSGVKIKKEQDAYDLISKDSVSQKNACPSDIKKLEDSIIDKYGITAVNLCEIDINFAREIGNVFEKIYTEYPSVRDNLTNLSLINSSLSEGYIAAFQATFPFATSDTKSTYPWVIKTQILLNTTYFLNQTRLEASVNDGSNSGHFPKNATVYSPVAHELGHYLSFLALLKSYNSNSILLIDADNLQTFYKIQEDFSDGKHSLSMINEAYENFKKDIGTTLSFDEWRNEISDYAVAKDNNGEYIYDETIAEAFHDVYLNGENANIVSKYVVDVLKDKLEG